MDYNPNLYNTYLNMQNNIDLREINRLLKEIINLKEENIRLQKIIDDNEDDEKWPARRNHMARRWRGECILCFPNV